MIGVYFLRDICSLPFDLFLSFQLKRSANMVMSRNDLVLLLVTFHTFIMPSIALFYTNSRENDYPRIGKRMDVADILRGVVTGTYRVPNYLGRVQWYTHAANRPIQKHETLDLSNDQILNKKEDKRSNGQYKIEMPRNPDILSGTDFFAEVLKKARELKMRKADGSEYRDTIPYVLESLKAPESDKINIYKLAADGLDEVGKVRYQYSTDLGKLFYRN